MHDKFGVQDICNLHTDQSNHVLSFRATPCSRLGRHTRQCAAPHIAHGIRDAGCWNIRSLSTLSQSLELFHLYSCDGDLMKYCQTVGHPNWEKIEHIPRNFFEDWVQVRKYA